MVSWWGCVSVSPSGHPASDLCAGVSGLRRVPGGLQSVPVRAAMPRRIHVHGMYTPVLLHH